MTSAVADTATSRLGGVGAPPRPARWHHWMAIVACVGIFLVAALLEPGVPGRSGLTVAGRPLPETCIFLRTTGLPCPGCGLTRSCVAAVHGQVGESLAFHPLGLAVLAYALLQAGRHAVWLAAPRHRPWVDLWGGRLDYGLIILPIVMVLVWAPGIAHQVWHRL